jgi:hypothetical protein
MRRLGILTVIAMILLLTLPVPTEGTTGSRLEGELTVELEATRVYGLNLIKLPEWMNYSKAVTTGSSLVLAGSGYAVELSLDSLTFRWAHSIVGRVTALTVDSKPARWASIGSSLGEVTVVDLTSPSYKTTFYTASRAPVKDAFVVHTRGGFRLLVLDELGFLYAMRVVRGFLGGGWFELGPTPHKGALTGIYGLKAISVHPAVLLTDWGSYKLLGNIVAVFSDITLPHPGTRSSFLGGFIVDVLYDDGGLLLQAYTGAFNKSLNVVETRSLYYAVKHGRYLVPLPPGPTEGNIYQASGSTINVRGLPPGDYEVLVFYEIKTSDRITGYTYSSSCYAGVGRLKVTPGHTVRGEPLILKKLGGGLEECLRSFKLHELYVAEAMQVLLLLDLTRLPESFSYGEDGNVVLLPIPRELLEAGIPNLIDHGEVILAMPGPGTPVGWEDLGIEAVLLVPVGGWLLIYYVGRGLTLADVGYMQPQTIYFGSKITAISISPDASRIYVGLESGAVFKLEWLRAKPLRAFDGGLANRYIIDSSLEVGGGPVTYVGELDAKVAVVSTARGRLQVVRLDDIISGLTPLWRGPPGFEGIDTGLSNIVFTMGSPGTLVAFSQGSRELYLFKGVLRELTPLVVNIVPVSFRDDGSWFISPPPQDLRVVVSDSRGVTVAVDRQPGGRATLYLPSGFYSITFESSWGVASVNLTVTPGFNERTIALVQEPGGRAYAELLEGGVTIADVIAKRPPRASVDIRFVDVDGNPVLSKLKVTLEGRGYTSSTTAINGVARFENVPLGAYRVLVEPLEGPYDRLETHIRVTVRGAEPRIVELRPLTLTITLKLVDRQFKTVITEPFLVKLERLEAGSSKLAYTREVRVVGQAKLQLPVGTYKVTLIPAGRDLYQVPREYRFIVEKPGEVTIELQPKTFTLTIQARDPWGSHLSGARVTITRYDGLLSLEGETDQNGILSVAIPPGAYEVKVSKMWFKDTVVSVNVLGDETVDVTVEPGMMLRLRRFLPYMIAVFGALIASTIILWARRVVSERLREEYF